MRNSKAVLLFAFLSLIFFSFRFASVSCTVFSRYNISQADSVLYDSLLQEKNGFFTFESDTIIIYDSIRVKSLPRMTGSNVDYYPRYLQFKGTFDDFLTYILCVDPSLDSVITCDKKVRLYYSNRCDFCDSGFWYGTMYLAYEYHYYRFQEIYGAFFSFSDINEVEVFVGGANRTYLPFASDLPVYAPNKSMRKHWFVKDVDYAKYFPVDFPSTIGGDFILTDADDIIWRESAANRFTVPRK